MNTHPARGRAGQNLLSTILVLFLLAALSADQGCSLAFAPPPPPPVTSVPAAPSTTSTTSTSPLSPTTTIATAMQVTITQATTSTVAGYVTTPLDATGQPVAAPIQVTLIAVASTAATTGTSATSTPVPLIATQASTATTAPGVPLGTPAFTFPVAGLDSARAAYIAVGKPVYVSATRADGATANSAAVALQGN